mgnify:CR=1 FL=1
MATSAFIQTPSTRQLRSRNEHASTNTFNATKYGQFEYETDHLVREINFAAVDVAKKAREAYQKHNRRPVWIAGSIGRTDLPGGDHPTMLRSLRDKVLTLPDDIVVLRRNPYYWKVDETGQRTLASVSGKPSSGWRAGSTSSSASPNW